MLREPTDRTLRPRSRSFPRELLAIAEAGLRISDDISVVGFDDFPEARWVSPHLTTVRRPLKDMAATATTLLVRMINGETLDSHRHELATVLVERASTRPLA